MRRIVPPLALAFFSASISALAMPRPQESILEDSRDLERIALSHVSSTTRTALSRLKVANSRPAHFSALGLRAWSFKIDDVVTSSSERVLVALSGHVLDESFVRDADAKIRKSRHGRIDSALRERMELAQLDKTLPVMIWVTEKDEFSPARPDPNAMSSARDVEDLLALNDEDRSLHVAKTVYPVFDAIDRLGGAPQSDAYVPVVYAELPASLIEEVSEWPEVDMVYLLGHSEQQLDVSRVVSGMALAHQTYGATGRGIRVGEIEVGGDVNLANPFLPGVTRNTTCGWFDNHGTGVAGVIKSTDVTHRGYAPDCTLFVGSDCNRGWSALQTQATAAVNWGALVLNLSFGADIGLTPGAQDRFYDTIVYNNLRTVVVAAGNTGSGTGNIISPALGYNVIAVGSFDDRGTNRNAISNYQTTWGDDSMSWFSSFRDPSSVFGDREKPELCAPGSYITMTSIQWPWLNYTNNGTSFAAPAVTGTVASMLSQNVNLPGWPEAVKAILMATALHNIEGSTRLSEYDGAGAMDSYAAVRCTRRTQGNWGGYSYTCSGAPIIDVQQVYLTAGRRVRVAIAWQSNPNYSNWSREPSADLDLRVLDPTGREIALSNSYDNTFEIVDFVVARTGYHTFRVNKEWCGSSPRAFGWAWY